MFSVEELVEEKEFVLLASGRYAQSIQYIERLAANNSFVVREKLKTKIRKESGVDIMGLNILLVKTELGLHL